MKINAVIVEDEKKSAELMLALLKKHCPEISVLGIAGNVDTAVEMIKKELLK